MEYGYLGLLASSFLAATILPLSSEVVLVALATTGEYPAQALWLIATLGNTAGSLVNWWLGMFALHFADRRWFPVGAEEMEKASARFIKYGLPSLLFAWVPIIGDPLTVIAGVMRVPVLTFLLLVAAGKGGALRICFVGGDVRF